MPRIACLALPLILTAAVLLLAPSAHGADACGKHLRTTCTSCHSLNSVCDKLGLPVKEWQAILERMIRNGTEMKREEVEPMAICMSRLSKAAKAACGR